jgi:hypothetical protein
MGVIDEMRAMREAAQAQRAAERKCPCCGAPPGWRLVPPKPTPAMRDALRLATRRDRPSDEVCDVRYAALLAAADSERGVI